MDSIFYHEFFQNRVLDYLVSLGIFIAGYLAVKVIFKSIVVRRIKAWAERTSSPLGEILTHIFGKTLLPILYFGAFYVALGSLTLPSSLDKALEVLGVVVVTVFGIRFLIAITFFAVENYWISKEPDESRQQNLRRLFPLVKVVIWGIGIVFLLDNLGFRISTVVAGLGIGGIAVALAAQAVLGDLFSYFSILFDKPFELGDFIIVGDLMGTVEHVGIKTTRIRSLSGEQLVFANTDLTSSRVKNYKRMESRRIAFRIGVLYETPLARVKEIPGLIKEIIDGIAEARFDRAHFFSYGDFSLLYEIVYYVLAPDYNTYMDVQQRINFALREEFDKRGIVFAYPTQTLYVNKVEPAAGGGKEQGES